MKKLTANKGLGWWIDSAVAVLGLVLAVIMLATYQSVLPNGKSAVVPALLLIAAFAVQVGVSYVSVKCAGYLSVLLYSAAFAVTATKIPEMMAEMVNRTNYVMGSVAGCLFYIIAAFVLAAAAVVACFFAQTADAQR